MWQLVTTDVNVFKFIHVTNKDVIWNYFSAQETYVWHAEKHLNATRIFELQLLQSCFPWCNLHAFTAFLSLKGFCISNVTISYQPLVVFTKKKKDENSCLLKICSSAYLHEVMDLNYVHYIAESIHLTHKNHWIQVFQSHPWTQVYKIQHVGTKSASPNTFLKERVTLCSSGCSTHLCNTSSCY